MVLNDNYTLVSSWIKLTPLGGLNESVNKQRQPLQHASQCAYESVLFWRQQMMEGNRFRYVRAS